MGNGEVFFETIGLDKNFLAGLVEGMKGGGGMDPGGGALEGDGALGEACGTYVRGPSGATS